MANWNPWHGCHKFSPGCLHCYVYRSDARYEKDSSLVTKTTDFGLPLKKKRDGSWKLEPRQMVWTCFTSDFLVEDADPWRDEAWEMMRQRPDLTFLFITKRIHRLEQLLPPDWGAGWPHVRICCTVENQQAADFRLPIFRDLPIAWKGLACEPLLEDISLGPAFGPWLRLLVAGGESGPQARVCDYRWILHLRQQCIEQKVAFHFKQTGALLRKDGRLYRVERRLQHSQARKAGINYRPPAQKKQPPRGG